MTDAPDTPPPPDPAAQVWEHIRKDYLAGESAPVLAERYGWSERTIRRRAALEGWRRADRTAAAADFPLWAAAPDRDEELGDRPELAEAEALRSAENFALLFGPTAVEMRAIAFRRSAEAAAMGHPAEAVVWMRLVQQLDRTGDRLDRERRAFSQTDYVRAAYIERVNASLSAEEPDEGGEEA